MAINKIEYDVLTTGISVYHQQAEAIGEVMGALKTMNDQLQDGWTNQTATAFIERYTEEYGPALENVQMAIQSISDFINNYMQSRQNDDVEGANAVRG